MASPPDEDFRKGVKPLAEPRRVVRALPRPTPLPRETLPPDQAIDTDEEIAFLRPGLSSQMLRRLRRGHWVVEDHLDLHGMNRSQAATRGGRIPARLPGARALQGWRAHRPRQGAGLAQPRAGAKGKGLPLAEDAGRGACLFPKLLPRTAVQERYWSCLKAKRRLRWSRRCGCAPRARPR